MLTSYQFGRKLVPLENSPVRTKKTFLGCTKYQKLSKYEIGLFDNVTGEYTFIRYDYVWENVDKYHHDLTLATTSK